MFRTVVPWYKDIVLIIGIPFYLLNIADAVVTQYGVKLDVISEANPTARSLAESGDLIWYKATIPLTLVVILFLLRRWNRLFRWTVPVSLIICTVGLIVVVANNVWVVVR